MAGELRARAPIAQGYVQRSGRCPLLGLLAVGLMAAACTPTTELGEVATTTFGGRGRVAITQGSAVALTQDERIAVVTHRTDGVVSVLHMAGSKEATELVLDSPRTTLPFHPLNASKPWAAVIGADDDTAYVLLRGPGQVVRIGGLHGGRPRETGRVDVGSEPTAIVISPSGKTLYVANSGEGSISVILTKSLEEARWDLNQRLASTGLVGPLVTTREQPAVWSASDFQSFRPALAHPRALAITDNGDAKDDDETLYATEFFSQPLLDATLSDPDGNRQGLVYPIIVGVGGGNPPLDAEGQPVAVIPLLPVDTGFRDAEGSPTRCFPNQLYGAATQSDRLYVTSLCASPAGPVDPGPAGELVNNNFKTLLHPSLSVIDTRGHREVPEEGLVLTRELERAYAPDALDRRMPLIPSEVVMAPAGADGARQAYVSAFGAGAVFPIRRDASGVAEVGSDANRYIDLGSSALPIGMAILSRQRALVLDDRKPRLAVVDLEASRTVLWRDLLKQDWEIDAGSDPQEVVTQDAREGRRLFATGLQAWSLNGQAWSSCESCHPEGLSDGVTWRFARGPRRTLSLAGTYYRDDPQRRMLLWSANVDELHDVEGIARGVSGGVGGVVWNPYADVPHKDCRLLYDGKAPAAAGGGPRCAAPKPTSERLTGLNGSLAVITLTSPGGECPANDLTCDINGSRDWDHIDAFARTVRAPRAPTTLDPFRVAGGKGLFEERCSVCHGGPGWTLSRVFYTPGGLANGRVPYTDLRVADPSYVADASAIDSMLGMLRTTSYKIPAAAPKPFQLATSGVGALGVAPFRSAPPEGSGSTELLDYLYVTGTYKSAPLDQVNCVLRSVGTFPDQVKGAAPDFAGVVPLGAPGVREARRVLEKQPQADNPAVMVDVYVEKLALGTTGFNIPSLVGLAGGGPYFHAGNARTLEEVFDPAFSPHHAPLAGGSADLTPGEIQDLVSYLLSIDESDESEPVPVPSPANGKLSFDPDLCAQFATPAGN